MAIAQRTYLLSCPTTTRIKRNKTKMRLFVFSLFKEGNYV
jgi:hypothetical protein